MEITLNLLPPYLLRQRELERRKRTRMVALAIAVLPIVLAYALLNARIQLLRLQAARLDHQVAALTPLAEKALRLEADLTALRQREAALTQLTARLPHWSTVLVRLTTVVPPAAWFTSLSITNGQVAIVGQAANESTISVLTARLAAARFLTGTSLKYVREGTIGVSRVYTFEIDGTVQPDGTNP